MSILDWLKNKTMGKEAGELTFSAEEENFEGLNMKEVINAHLGWKTRLERVINGVSTERLDPEVIEKNNQCALGKWIEASQKKFGDTREFQSLKEAHDQFHKYAAQVLVERNNGSLQKAYDLLEHEVKLFSSRVQFSIIELYAKIYKQQGKL